MFITYMVVKIVIYIVRTNKKHNARRNKEELELMASRKAKRRSAAARAKDRSSPTAPTQH
jgi:hypothetical protein